MQEQACVNPVTSLIKYIQTNLISKAESDKLGKSSIDSSLIIFQRVLLVYRYMDVIIFDDKLAIL